jgi:hypothetical protein
MQLFEKHAKVAHKFLSSWSQCLTQGNKVRMATQLSLGEKGLKTHAVRWMAEYRAAVQVFKHFEKIEYIIQEEDVGCASLIGTLREILDNEEDKSTLLLELALITDSGNPIASFCNHFEGDGYLAPYVHDKWISLSEHMNHVIDDFPKPDCQSAVREIASKIAPNDPARQLQLINTTVAKAVAVAQKLHYDTQVRLRETLQIFRGCRLLGYQYVRNNTLEALVEEIEFIHFLPIAVPLIAALKRELRTYKEKADAYENDDGWLFWRTFYNVLPTWYKVAADVALVMTSSACVERVFSLLNSRFSDQQQRALQDYKECTLRIMYNETFRDKIQYP